MAKNYTANQKKLLLALSKTQHSKTTITKRYWKLKPSEREQLLQELIDDGLVHSELCPQPNTRKAPTFYFLTKAGKQWVKNYLKKFSA